VALMTESEKGNPIQVQLTMKLAEGADLEISTEVVLGRVEMFDEDGEVWVEEDRWLKVRARRAGMSPEHITDWARFLAERLLGMEVLQDAEVEVEIAEPK